MRYCNMEYGMYIANGNSSNMYICKYRVIEIMLLVSHLWRTVRAYIMTFGLYIDYSISISTINISISAINIPELQSIFCKTTRKISKFITGKIEYTQCDKFAAITNHKTKSSLHDAPTYCASTFATTWSSWKIKCTVQAAFETRFKYGKISLKIQINTSNVVKTHLTTQ